MLIIGTRVLKKINLIIEKEVKFKLKFDLA